MKQWVPFIKIYACDRPKGFSLGFQDPATEFIEGIIDLHHDVFSYLVFIGFFVLVLFLDTVWLFNIKNNQIFAIDNRHNSLLEIFWTSIPAFILLLIATPSFALIYAMDEVGIPQITIKVIGNQWYWSYEYSNALDLITEESNFLDLTDDFEKLNKNFSLFQFFKNIFVQDEKNTENTLHTTPKKTLYRPFGISLDRIDYQFQFVPFKQYLFAANLFWVFYLKERLNYGHSFDIEEYLRDRDSLLLQFWVNYRFLTNSLVTPVQIQSMTVEKFTDLNLTKSSQLVDYGLLGGAVPWNILDCTTVLENRAILIHWLLANYKRYYWILRYENQPNFFRSFKNIYLSNWFNLFFKVDSLNRSLFTKNAFLYNICHLYTLYDSYTLLNWLGYASKSSVDNSFFIMKRIPTIENDSSSLEYPIGRAPWWSNDLTQGSSYELALNYMLHSNYNDYAQSVKIITGDNLLFPALSNIIFKYLGWYNTSDIVDHLFVVNRFPFKIALETFIKRESSTVIHIDWLVDYLVSITNGYVPSFRSHLSGTNSEMVMQVNKLNYSFDVLFNLHYGYRLTLYELAVGQVKLLEALIQVLGSNKTLNNSRLHWDSFFSFFFFKSKQFLYFLNEAYCRDDKLAVYAKPEFDKYLQLLKTDNLSMLSNYIFQMNCFKLFNYRTDVESTGINILSACVLQNYWVNKSILNWVFQNFLDARNFDSDLKLFFWTFRTYPNSISNMEFFNTNMGFMPSYYFQIYYKYGLLGQSASLFPNFLDCTKIDLMNSFLFGNKNLISWVRLLNLFDLLGDDRLLFAFEQSYNYSRYGNLMDYWYSIEVFRSFDFLASFCYFKTLYGDPFSNPLVNYSKHIIGDFKWLFNVKKFFYSYIHINYESRLIEYDDLIVLPYGPAFRLLEVDRPLILPIEIDIRFIISANDVLHSWTVPSFGIKIDACPGRSNEVSLYLKRSGLFYGQCSELCGINHGFMPIEVFSISIGDFLDWIRKFIN